MRGIHEKSLLQATLFGLPMLKVDLPPGGSTRRLPPAAPGTTGYTTNPGLTLGVEAADITVMPMLMEKTGNLSNTTALSDTITATYLEGGDGRALNPVEAGAAGVDAECNRGRPGVAGNRFPWRQLHGRIQHRTPHQRAGDRDPRHPFPVPGPSLYPIRAWDANYFDALSNPSGGITKLVVMPAQFKANDLVGIEGTLRKYSDMGFRLFYSDNTASFPEANVPALAAPPEIAQVTSITGTNTVTFTVQTTSDPSVGVQEVWVTYTATSGPFYGTWQSQKFDTGCRTTQPAG